MCDFFSSITYDGAHLYFNWEQRKAIIGGDKNYSGKDMTQYQADSHSSIADYYGVPADKCNKYEFNPLTGDFTIDQINNGDDSERAERWCQALDFSKIVEPLIIKPIVHPFHIAPPEKITEKHIALIKEWASARASVGASSVGDSVGDSVRDSVGDSVWASVGASVGGSVWASVRASVGASVRAYYASFFNLPEFSKYKPLLELWELGLVPSFDGTSWRLHGGRNTKVLWKGEI